jgi:amidase
MNDIAFIDAIAQADLVRRKQIKPIELVDAAIERIERINPQINAVVTPMYDEARKAASGPLPEGPFTGVPFLMKDLIAQYGGVRCTAASAFLGDYVSGEDSELVKRYKHAGLIVVGKTNTPEFGLVPTTEPALFGPCRNPWNTGRTTGGSSGGSAAAVASAMVPMAHGNDGGGSIRIPASCCGLFGLKPTRGRTPLGPQYGDMITGLVCEHAITRSVRDSAALLDATCGPAGGDPYYAPPPERPFLQEVGADPGLLRIAFSSQTAVGTPVHPDCLAALKDAAALCQELGHEVVEAAPEIDLPKAANAFINLWIGHTTWEIDDWARRTGRTPKQELFEPVTWAMYTAGRSVTAATYLLSLQDIQAMSRDVARFFADYDLCLTPTLGEPPLPLGTLTSTPENPMMGFVRAGMFVPFTPLQNGTGQPAMSVPLYWNDEGLPIGVHFAARFGDEATLFRLASQLEEARPWAHKRPPVCA